MEHREKTARQKSVFVTSLMDNMLAYGIIAVFLIFIFVILWDDYVFYNVNYKSGDNSDSSINTGNITDGDFDNLDKILSERDTQFNNLLNSSANFQNKNPTANVLNNTNK